MKKVISILLLGLAAAFVLPAQATTTSITQDINLNTVYNGYTPDPPTSGSSWLTAQFSAGPFDSTTGFSSGTLNLNSFLSSTDKVQGANGVTGWAFYLDPSLFGGTSLTCTNSGSGSNGITCSTPYSSGFSITCTSGTCPNTIWLGTIGQQGPVPGDFTLGFGWTSQNLFNGSDTASFSLTFFGNTGLQSSPFLFNGSGIYSYAHIQGISGSTTCSGYVISENGTTYIPPKGLYGSCGGTTNVPEPNDLGMFGIGVLLVGMFLGLNRRRLFN